MTTMLREIDARTNLAGTNQIELLLFHLGTKETFGLNVFKVQEIVTMPTITHLPETDARILGLVTIRNNSIAVVDLHACLKLSAAETAGSKGFLVLTHYSNSVQAFYVSDVDRIMRTSWTEIKTPPAVIRAQSQGMITGVTVDDRGQTILIPDVEKILMDLQPAHQDGTYARITAQPSIHQKTVLFVDDSSVARTQIRKTLEQIGVRFVQATTGQEAWRYLSASLEEGPASGPPQVDLVLSDIEMPEMDGFTLTQHIRATPALSRIPVILHSSLTGQCNQKKGQQVGATDYVTKFEPEQLALAVTRHLG